MISIVIPTYNEEERFEETLIGLAQLRDEATFELIVTDGQSSDRVVAEGYEFSRCLGERFRSIRITEPKLVVSARRQQRVGMVKTHLEWLLVQRLYRWGIPATWLARLYSDVR